MEMALNTFINVSKALDLNDIPGVLLGLESLPEELDNAKYQDTFISILHRFLSIKLKGNHTEAQFLIRSIMERLTPENARKECGLLILSKSHTNAIAATEYMIDNNMVLSKIEVESLEEFFKKEKVESSYLIERIAETLHLMRLSDVTPSYARMFLSTPLNIAMTKIRKSSNANHSSYSFPNLFLKELLILAPGHPFLEMNTRSAICYSPQILSNTYKCERIMEEYSNYARSFMYMDQDAKLLYPFISNICNRLKSVEFKQSHISSIACFWNASFQICHDFAGSNTQEMIQLFKNTSELFSLESRPLFLKMSLKLFGDKKSILNFHEPAIVALIIDTFRKDIQAIEFQKELGELWTIIFSLKYDNIFNSGSFYSSVFTLARAQALFKIKKELCRNVLTDILNPLYDQMVDFKKMMDHDGKKQSPVDEHERLGEDVFNMIVFTYNDAKDAIQTFINN